MRTFMLAALLGALLLAAPALAAQNVYDMVNDAVKAQSEGDLHRAFELYTQIIESGKLQSDPKILSYLHNNRAVIWLQRGSEGMALEDFQHSIELYPDHTAYYNRALILADRGRTQEALVDLSKAIKMFPKYAKAYELRGHLLLEQGQAAQARADLKKARELKLNIRFLGPGEFTAGPQGAELSPDNGSDASPLRQRMRVE